MKFMRMNPKAIRYVSAFLAVVMISQIATPVTVYALTGGPSQPEVQSFEPVGTSEMVDLFSGDFNYNIPLMDVDGYPINIAYHSGVTMDQEASWVGLGWNLNAGTVNRNMRGLPDDFKGDEVEKTTYVKPDVTVGIGTGTSLEMISFEKGAQSGIKKLLKKIPGFSGSVGLGLGINYNNYKGVAVETSISPSIQAGSVLKNKYLSGVGINGDMGLTISSSTRDGLSIKPKIGFGFSSAKMVQKAEGLGSMLGMSISADVSSRRGLKQLTFSTGYSLHVPKIKTDNGASNKIGSVDHTSVITYGAQTYTPKIESSTTNLNLSFAGRIGLEFLGLKASIPLNGYMSAQWNSDETVKRKAYGYYYSSASKEREGPADYLLDFNREKDGVYSKENPVLAIPQFTHDIYSVSGQGVGGMYRAYRSDLGLLHDPTVKSNNTALNIPQPEFALGNKLKIGLNYRSNYSETKSGAWDEVNGNNLAQVFGFRDVAAQKTDNLFYEDAYFKCVGEKSAVDKDLFLYDEGVEVLKPALDMQGGKIMTRTISSGTPLTKKAWVEQISSSGKIVNSLIEEERMVRKKRDKRSQLISVRTAEESAYCLERDINFALPPACSNCNGMGSEKRVQDDDGYRKAHHISEVSVTDRSGQRYVYGIPAYNTVQKEYSFTNAVNPDVDEEPIPGKDDALETGLIGYDNGSNFDKNSSRKFRGNDHFFSYTKTPAYAHSYLLTAVLSPDYVDCDRVKGPSAGDIGNYTKIKYYRTSQNYKWRTPYKDASYNEGYKSDVNDDAASFVYGEKEQWLMRSVEGREHIAVFKLEAREDGLGVAGLHGGKSTSQVVYRLNSIALYAKTDMTTPIKQVFFEYDYALCPGIDNSINNGGKLTLKKIYFKYGNSNKGKFNSYKFSYSSNQSYHIKGYDRWGNYKPSKESLDANALTANEFPYVDQNKTKTDEYAQAWSLTKIELPSGGEINVNYESDDYAYVQDRTAMCMYKIKGFSSKVPGKEDDINDKLFDDDGTDRNYVVLDLAPEVMPSLENAASFIEEVKRSGYFYFNMLTDLTDNGSSEYVRGYAEVESAGISTDSENSSIRYAWVQLKESSTGHQPIAQTAWQMARLNLPHLVYPGSDLRKSNQGIFENIIGVARGLFGYIFEVADMMEGFNNKLKRKGYGCTVNRGKAWVRLNSFNGHKLGGGVRVKEITLNDKWENFDNTTPLTSSSYGQRYSYETKEGSRTISSGVASYEPSIGNDENPFKRPVFYTFDNVMAPDDQMYVEEPFGESYFPSPTVGYSRVEVTNIVPENVNKHATGKVVHEFYTAKDYPTIVRKTEVESEKQRPSLVFNLLGNKVREYVTAVQGYSIELNDMHGKPKATWNYNQANVASADIKDAFSGIRYDYFTDAQQSNRLSNKVPVISNDNVITDEQVGVETDVFMDGRSFSSSTIGSGISLNIDGFFLGFIPIIIPMGLPEFNTEATEFNSGVIVKVVNRFGIVKRTIAFEEGSSLATENTLFDAQTGEVLLTKTQNEFSDNIYNAKYPAYWVYGGMGPAYINSGLTLSVEKGTGNDFKVKKGLSYENPDKYLVPGDELRLTYSTIDQSVWVHKPTTGNYVLIDRRGDLVVIPTSVTATVTVMKPARKNMLDATMVSVQSKQNPIITTTVSSVETRSLSHAASTKIIDANAVEYNDKWTIDNAYARQCYYWIPDPGEGTPMDPRTTPAFGTEMLNIVKYLFTSGQITAATYSSGLSDALINRSYANSEWYENSALAAYRDAEGKPHTFSFILGSPATTTPATLSFSIGPSNQITIKVPPIMYTILSQGHLLDNIEWKTASNSTSSSNVTAWVSYVDVFENTMRVEHHRDEIDGFIINFGETDDLKTSMTFCDKCVLENNLAINPYLSGIMGNWRTKRTWLYHDKRDQSANNIRVDGTYTTYDNFVTLTSGVWGINSLVPVSSPSNTAKWIWKEEVTKYSAYGEPLETKDALGRYNATLMGPNKNTPDAVAQNTPYRQLAFDGFEEYTAADMDGIDCPRGHFNFRGRTLVVVNDAHTGTGSVKITKGNNLETYRDLPAAVSPATDDRYMVSSADLNGLFEPAPGKYIFGAWVKLSDAASSARFNYATHVSVEIYQNVSGSPVLIKTIKPSGPVIEGWQRIDDEFEITGSGSKLTVKLVCENQLITGDESAYFACFDDLRIHPFNANMKSYVYDKRSKRLMAELDENNFASFYEYDEQGQLIRVKKETERGIMTLKEVRSYNRKSN